MYSLELFFGMLFLKCVLLLFRLKNILIILFAFEFLMVKLMFAFVYSSVPYDSITMLVFLAVAAGEASLGLTLLVSMMRQSGKDKLSVNISPWEIQMWSLVSALFMSPY